MLLLVLAAFPLAIRAEEQTTQVPVKVTVREQTVLDLSDPAKPQVVTNAQNGMELDKDLTVYSGI